MSNPESSDETALTILGQRVRSLRKEQGFSLRRFAEKTRLHPSYLSRIELGKVNVTMETLLCIAHALDIDVSQLLRPLDNRQELYLISGKSEKGTS